jgi:hypothetical protein
MTTDTDKTLEMTFVLKDSDGSMTIGLMEKLSYAFKNGRYVVKKQNHECVFHVGFGDSQKEAVLEYLISRLGSGFPYQQLQRYESGEIGLEVLAESIEADVEAVRSAIA